MSNEDYIATIWISVSIIFGCIYGYYTTRYWTEKEFGDMGYSAGWLAIMMWPFMIVLLVVMSPVLFFSYLGNYHKDKNNNK